MIPTVIPAVTILTITMDAVDQRALAQAVRLLEQPGFAARVAEWAGQPVGRIMGALPTAANDALRNIVTATMLKSLRVAISTLGTAPARDTSARLSKLLPNRLPKILRKLPPELLPKMMTGITGGVSGFFGLAALAVELPVTTTVMLRSIAEIARSEGENLEKARAKLACLEVFALGAGGSPGGMDIGYYAARAIMAQSIGEAATYLLERGVAEQTAPALIRLVTTIASRFGLVVSEKVLAGAIPVIGAVGGAAINIVFMDHFQNIARGHFIIRRLERKYGAEIVRSYYTATMPRHALQVTEGE